MSVFIALGFTQFGVRDFYATLDNQRGSRIEILDLEDLLPSSRRLVADSKDEGLEMAHDCALRAGIMDKLAPEYYRQLREMADAHLNTLSIFDTNPIVVTIGAPDYVWRCISEKPEYATGLEALLRRVAVVHCRVFNAYGGYTCHTLGPH